MLFRSLAMDERPNPQYFETERMQKLFAGDTSAIAIDLRRKDEQEIFGKASFMQCVDDEEFDDAMKLETSEFQSKYGFSFPNPNDAIVLICRTKRRALRVSLVLKEMGFSQVFVWESGVKGLHDFDENIHFYESYEIGDEVPPVLL